MFCSSVFKQKEVNYLNFKN